MAKQKLTIAHEEFSKAMLSRLRQKQRGGFSGWDDEDFNSLNIPRRMHDKSLNVLRSGEKCNPQDLLDIANFAMFLHNKIKEK